MKDSWKFIVGRIELIEEVQDKESQTMNRDGGMHLLSHFFDPLLKTSLYGKNTGDQVSCSTSGSMYTAWRKSVVNRRFNCQQKKI